MARREQQPGLIMSLKGAICCDRGLPELNPFLPSQVLGRMTFLNVVLLSLLFVIRAQEKNFQLVCFLWQIKLLIFTDAISAGIVLIRSGSCVSYLSAREE